MGLERTKSRGIWTPARIAIGLAISLTAWLLPAAAFGAQCEPGIIRDYAAPLAKLPHLPGLKGQNNKNLPFGPDGLSLVRRSSLQRVSPVYVVGQTIGVGSTVGYKLVNESFERPGTAQLNWRIVVTLKKLGTKGKVRSKSIGILRRGKSKVFDFAIPRQPGIYQLEFVASHTAGRRVGRVGEYFRVIEPITEAQISLSATTVHPGETLDACLENLGTSRLSFGEGFQIEVSDGATWAPSPLDPPGPESGVLFFAGPGNRLPLSSFRVPAGAQPGRYRYSWTTDPAGLTLAPEFQIAP